MTKEKYMALADVQSVWTNKLKPWIQQNLLIPFDVATLTPTSTFQKNTVIGINGVLYRSTAATGNLPCTLVTEDGAFVTHTVNGKTAFVVASGAPTTGWEIFTDAAVEYWVESINAQISALQTTTYGGYTPAQLFTAMAALMDKTVVTQP